MEDMAIDQVTMAGDMQGLAWVLGAFTMVAEAGQMAAR